MIKNMLYLYRKRGEEMYKYKRVKIGSKEFKRLLFRGYKIIDRELFNGFVLFEINKKSCFEGLKDFSKARELLYYKSKGGDLK